MGASVVACLGLGIPPYLSLSIAICSSSDGVKATYIFFFSYGYINHLHGVANNAATTNVAGGSVCKSD